MEEAYRIAVKRDRARINAQIHDVRIIVRARSFERRFAVVPSREDALPVDDCVPPPPFRFIIINYYFPI